MTWHAGSGLLRRYATNDPTLRADAVWAVEVHLETCADCRATLAAQLGPDPLLDQVWAGIDLDHEPAPAPARRRWLATWATPAMVPWLATTVLVLVIAFVADLVGSTNVSLALLLAPVAPVAGVAAAWARGIDPAHEIVAATPRAGLYLILRRTLAVLVVLIPLLTLTTWTSPVRWLLPCLVFTVATLALGGFVGIRRAAVGLLTAWSGLVIAPSLLTATPPAVLEPTALLGWAAALLLCVAVIRLRPTVYMRLER
jgi:hypothetical protein